jgi:hypothetical protein
VLFDNDTRFMYQGIFDTDFDKYLEDAIALFIKSGVSTVFENFENVGSENALSCPRHTAWCPLRRRVITVGRRVITVGGV